MLLALVAPALASATASGSVPQPGSVDRLNDVDCVSASNCLAVGSTRVSPDSNTDLPDILRLSGSVWQQQSAPETLGELDGVDCVTSRFCWATGDRGTLARWNGTQWTASRLPVPGAYPDIDDLTCVSRRDCWAVGVSKLPFAYQWNGSRWTATKVPNEGPARAAADTVTSVSCISASDCWAMETYFGEIPRNLRGQETSPGYLTALHWDGSRWSSKWTSPAFNAPDGLSFGAEVRCTSSTQCFAAGSARRGIVSSLILLRYSGGRWSQIAGPRFTSAGVGSLSCVTAVDCWMVGQTGEDFTHPQPLILHWDGSNVQSVPVTAPDSDLEGVSCTSSAFCLAVGGKGVEQGNIALRWDGRDWSDS
jgi:hypothetical protein